MSKNFIPISIVDNFFDDPNQVRKFAMDQEYKLSDTGSWPGLRTKSLHLINLNFFDMVTFKVMSLFFDESALTQMSWNTSMFFQKVDSKYKEGWIHQDHGGTIITGIVYLSDSPDCSKGGTSIYRYKPGVWFAERESSRLNRYKEESYLNISQLGDEEKHRQLLSSNFEETVKVYGKYNRLVAFDSNEHHGAQYFFGNNEESRLTLVIFFHNIMSMGRHMDFPIQRKNNFQ